MDLNDLVKPLLIIIYCNTELCSWHRFLIDPVDSVYELSHTGIYLIFRKIILIEISRALSRTKLHCSWFCNTRNIVRDTTKINLGLLSKFI
jgi:hypothetical protein